MVWGLLKLFLGRKYLGINIQFYISKGIIRTYYLFVLCVCLQICIYFAYLYFNYKLLLHFDDIFRKKRKKFFRGLVDELLRSRSPDLLTLTEPPNFSATRRAQISPELPGGKP